jgi:hypothetical protein
VLAQAPHQRLVLRSGLKLRTAGNARIHTEQALLRALRQGRKDLGYGLLARGPEAGTAHHADSESTKQDDRRQYGHEVGRHRSLGPMTLAFAQPRAPLHIGTQADDG